MALKEVLSTAFPGFGPGLALLIGVISVLIVILVALKLVERNMLKELAAKNIDIEKVNRIKRTVNILKNQDLGDDMALEMMDSFARKTFVEYLCPGEKAEYSHLEEHFRNKNQTDLANFCKSMNLIMYSGEKLNARKIKALMQELEDLIDKHIMHKMKILDKEEAAVTKAKHKKYSRLPQTESFDQLKQDIKEIYKHINKSMHARH